MMNLNDIPLEINGGTIISNDNITCRNTKENAVVNRALRTQNQRPNQKIKGIPGGVPF